MGAEGGHPLNAVVLPSDLSQRSMRLAVWCLPQWFYIALDLLWAQFRSQQWQAPPDSHNWNDATAGLSCCCPYWSCGLLPEWEGRARAAEGKHPKQFFSLSQKEGVGLSLVWFGFTVKLESQHEAAARLCGWKSGNTPQLSSHNFHHLPLIQQGIPWTEELPSSMRSQVGTRF